MITVTVDYQSKLVLMNIGKMPRLAINGMRRGLREIGMQLIKTAKDGVKNPPKTGKVYRYKGRIKQASSPGEYPANRSGNYRRGLGFKNIGNDKLEFGARAEYSKFLEDGTVKMKPRPALLKSIEKNKSKMVDLMADSLNKELKI